MKGAKTDTMFFTSEDCRLRPVIGHTIIFTSEKNRPTNQIASNFQRDLRTSSLVPRANLKFTFRPGGIEQKTVVMLKLCKFVPGIDDAEWSNRRHGHLRIKKIQRYLTKQCIHWMKNAKLTNEDATCEKGSRGFKMFRPNLYKLE